MFTNATERLLSWEVWYIVLMCIHVLGGSLALLTFWIPIATEKGSPAHINGGLAFLSGVFMASLTGIVISLMLFKDPLQPPAAFAYDFFLFFLSYFTLVEGLQGVAAIRQRRRAGYGGPWPYYFLNGGLVALSAATAIIGYRSGHSLVTLFPLIGLWVGLKQLAYWSNSNVDEKQMLKQHLTAMLICVIATITAFCVIALTGLFSLARENMWLWFAPTLIFLPIISYWRWRVERE